MESTSEVIHRTFVVEEVTEADEQRLCDLYVQMVHEEGELCDRSLIWKLYGLNRQQPYRWLFKLVADGEMVGFQDIQVFERPVYPTTISVSQCIYVHPDYRGHGWRLIRRCLRVANEHQASVFCIADEKKRRFWEKGGFRAKRILMERDYGYVSR